MSTPPLESLRSADVQPNDSHRVPNPPTCPILHQDPAGGPYLQVRGRHRFHPRRLSVTHGLDPDRDFFMGLGRVLVAVSLHASMAILSPTVYTLPV